MELMIVEQSGWKKPVKIEKAVTRMGSAPSNDIQLNSPQVAPYQLQILYSASETPQACKVLNLGGPLRATVRGVERTLDAYETLEFGDDDEIDIDTYRVMFSLPVSAGILAVSSCIGATLKLPNAQLRTDAPTVGSLLVKNTGERTASQFQVAVSGLPGDCFRVDPIPLLYPGGQEEVRIQFFHRHTYPPAGVLTVTLSISAPEAYPGEQVVIRQGLYVKPVLTFRVGLVDDMPVPQDAPLPEPVIALEPDPLPVPSSPLSPPQPSPEENPPVDRIPEPVVPAVRDVSRLKVVKGTPASYWDETNE